MGWNDSMVAWNRQPSGRRRERNGDDPVAQWNANAWGGFTRAGTPVVALAVLAAWATDGWLRFARAGVVDAEIAAPLPGAALTLAVRIAMFVLEALWYRIVWAALGRRLRFAPFVIALLLASSLDLCAIARRHLAPDAGTLLRIGIGGLAGSRGLEPLDTVSTAPGGPFATLGLLTLGRIALTAWAQAHGLKRGLIVPLLVTATTWLVSHLALAWYADFARGIAHGSTP